MKCEKLDKI